MVWNYQNADCSLRKKLILSCRLLQFSAHVRFVWLSVWQIVRGEVVAKRDHSALGNATSPLSPARRHRRRRLPAVSFSSVRSPWRRLPRRRRSGRAERRLVGNRPTGSDVTRRASVRRAARLRRRGLAAAPRRPAYDPPAASIAQFTPESPRNTV